MSQCTANYFPWMDAGSINGAMEQLFVFDDAVFAIQKQAGKNLILIAGESYLQVFPGLFWAGQGIAPYQ